jgi:23S rRNA (adenine2503-C2)-methyltransferase
MDRDLLEQTLSARGEPAYRARQVWEWACRGVASYDEMTTLPSALRAQLAESAPLSTLAVEREREARDGTVKTLFRTHDGHPVEAVLMRYRDGRRSVCLSTQSGCALSCAFCATGTMRLNRNLTVWEILDQALHFRRSGQVTNGVLMGMGEPMLNLDAVLAVCRLLPEFGISQRRTAISTAGWVPGIDRFTAEDIHVRLALSLHAPDDKLRSALMPVNDRYPIAEVLAACERFYAHKRRKVFVEYVMLEDVNDSRDKARALARLLDPKIYKLNLIPYNPTGAFSGSSREAIASFRRVLERSGLSATVRVDRGREIEAACGQLAARVS